MGQILENIKAEDILSLSLKVMNDYVNSNIRLIIVCHFQSMKQKLLFQLITLQNLVSMIKNNK